MKKLRVAASSLILTLAFFSALSPGFAQAGNKGNGRNVSSGSSKGALAADDCSSKMPREVFSVDFSGSVANAGRTYEGPLCVEVFYNPIQQFVGLQTSTTTVAGPDLSKVILGGTSAGGAALTAPIVKKPTGLSSAVGQLEDDAKKLSVKLIALKATYSTVMQAEDSAIGGIAALRQTTRLLNGTDAISKVKGGYEGLRPFLNTALKAPADLVPSDRADSSNDFLLSEAQAQEDRLNALPLDYGGGSQAHFVCVGSDDQPGWSDWIGQCKDQYSALKSILDNNLQTAKNFASDSDNLKGLKAKVAITQYWDTLFATLGLRTSLTNAEIEVLDIGPKFYTHTSVHCGLLFNQTSNTAVNIVTADLTSTLQGNDPTIKAQGVFVTVSCGTPFAVSAGVGFNTIEQKQFAILPSPDGKGGTVNTFGLTSDSRITPVALALVHVRLAEWSRHKFAFYGSLGVGGSLQNQSTSSPVQFLPGVSLSFWRTMYLTAGPDIGNKTSLAGGFKVGDVVPSGVTSVPTQTSHAVGFGFAISFTKP